MTHIPICGAARPRPLTTNENRTNFWRREAERQARLVREAQELVIYERNRCRWAWWMWGVVVGSVVGLLVMWRPV